MAVSIQNFQLSPAAVSAVISFYYQFNKQTEEEIRSREAIRSEIENILGRVGFRPALTQLGGEEDRRLVHITGSTADGFGLVESDLDLTLVKPAFQALSEDQVVVLIQRIVAQNGANIQLKQPPDHARAFPEAHVPIVYFTFTSNPASLSFGSTTTMHPINCDLSIRRENAIRSAKLFAWFVNSDVRAAVLFAVIKKWAVAKGVYGTQHGHLNSFPWKLLLIHYLQQGCSPTVLPKVAISPGFHELPRMEVGNYRYTNMAELLAGFFGFYSMFRFSALRISITNSYQPLHHVVGAAPMYIEDPYDSQFNCARAVTTQTLGQLQSAFATGYTEAVSIVLRDALCNLSQISLS